MRFSQERSLSSAFKAFCVTDKSLPQADGNWTAYWSITSSVGSVSVEVTPKLITVPELVR